MRALLDTHALLWALSDDPRLSAKARAVVESLENDVLVSAVSAWEIAVKVGLRKLEAPEDLESTVRAAGFSVRAVGIAECSVLRTLPALHRDPFDRMLVAQAMVDGIAVITKDEQIARYPIQTIW